MGDLSFFLLIFLDLLTLVCSSDVGSARKLSPEKQGLLYITFQIIVKYKTRERAAPGVALGFLTLQPSKCFFPPFCVMTEPYPRRKVLSTTFHTIN